MVAGLPFLLCQKVINVFLRKKLIVKQFYLLRLDDACPTMDGQKWKRMEDILQFHNVKPMVGVIPHNEDTLNIIDPIDVFFWEKVKKWHSIGWTIAMHGYNHKYNNNGMKGLNPLWKESEFVNETLSVQRNKIKNGVAIMREHGLNPEYFFAPSHTFDENTLIALKEESDIRIISDTIASKPYKYNGLVFIPQQSGHPIKLPFGGLLTICYHPNAMDDNSFKRLELFLMEHKDDVLSFADIDLSKVRSKSMGDRLLSWLYFLHRKLR